MSLSESTYKYLAEVMGTFLLLFFGDMSIAVSFMGDTNTRLFQIVMGWFFAVFIAIYTIGGISGAHINPAVTIALWFGKRFPKKDVLPYIVSQLIGAFLGGMFTYIFWSGMWSIYDPNFTKWSWSQILHCHYPNPAMFPDAYPVAEGGNAATLSDALKWGNAHWPLWLGFLIEFVMTALLLFTIVAAGDPDSPLCAGKWAGAIVALYVGFACFITPMTMTCMNPARDTGPRFLTLMLGYGHIAFPGYRWEWPVIYVIPQILGGIAGVYLWDYIFKPYFKLMKK